MANTPTPTPASVPLAADFQALPLGYIISEPLKATINAQTIAANTTKDFINGFIQNGKPVTVDFSASINNGTDASGNTKTTAVNVSAPLLAMVPVPHLRIDSLTIHFKYEVSMIEKSTQSTASSADLSVQSGSVISPWVNASLKGSISSNSSNENSTNRNGVLEITVNASESPIPEGLSKILGIMTNAITVTPATVQPPAQPQ